MAGRRKPCEWQGYKRTCGKPSVGRFRVGALPMRLCAEHAARVGKGPKAAAKEDPAP